MKQELVEQAPSKLGDMVQTTVFITDVRNGENRHTR
jgi:hypothetical protein